MRNWTLHLLKAQKVLELVLHTCGSRIQLCGTNEQDIPRHATHYNVFISAGPICSMCPYALDFAIGNTTDIQITTNSTGIMGKNYSF